MGINDHIPIFDPNGMDGITGKDRKGRMGLQERKDREKGAITIVTP